MTREMGKPLQETRGDVQEGIDTAYYAATEGRRLFGHTVPSELRAKWAMSFRRPIGVCGLVTPFNFPLAIPDVEDVSGPAVRKFGASSSRPRMCRTPATVLVEILLEAGLPPEVIQLVHGFGETVGAAIVEHPDDSGRSRSPDRPKPGASSARCAAGCTSGCRSRWAARTRRSCSTTPNLDLALDGVLWGAFGTTGQRCTATSRLILQRRHS